MFRYIRFMEIKFKIIYYNKNTNDFRTRVYTLDELTSRTDIGYSVNDLYSDLSYSVIAKLQYSGFDDKDGENIFDGDIVEFENEDGDKTTAICQLGSAKRVIYENDVEIHGFYFLVKSRKSFPIIYNYAGKHDTELFKVIGNTSITPIT